MINLALRKEYKSFIDMLVAVFSDWDTCGFNGEGVTSSEAIEYLAANNFKGEITDDNYHRLLWSSWKYSEAEIAQRAYDMYSQTVESYYSYTEYQIHLDDKGKVEAIVFVAVD